MASDVEDGGERMQGDQAAAGGGEGGEDDDFHFQTRQINIIAQDGKRELETRSF